MKRRVRWFPLMISLLLLAGCAAGGQGKQSGEDLALTIQKGGTEDILVHS